MLFAVKRAIESARHDAGNDDIIFMCKYIHLFLNDSTHKDNYGVAIFNFLLYYVAAPTTVEDIQLLCLTNISQMVYQLN